MPGKGAKGNMGFGCSHTVHLVYRVSYHCGDILVIPDADKRDEVYLARHGVDLANTCKCSDGFTHLRDAGNFGLHEDDGSDHLSRVSVPPGGVRIVPLLCSARTVDRRTRLLDLRDSWTP